MNLEEIIARLNAIAAEAATATGEALAALETEQRQLTEQLNAARNEAQRRQALRDNVARGLAGVGVPGVTHEPEPAPAESRGRDSDEYRRAWLRNIAVRDGVSIFGEMTEAERAAFTFTTANTGSVVPTTIENRIIELVRSESPMLDDAMPSNLSRGFGVPRHKAIVAGDAAGVVEGTANADDEQDLFDLLSLDGVEIKKHVVLSRKMSFKSIDAFEDWLVRHLADRIRVAKENVILARLDGTAPTGGSVIADSGIAEANILTAQSYTDAAIRGILARIHARGVKVVYANSSTIWNHLAGIVDDEGKKLFVPSGMVDPVEQGRIYGASVKEDPNLADNVVYFGVKGQILANDYDELTIFSAIEPKTADTIETAYSLFDAGLQDPKGFVKATFTP